MLIHPFYRLAGACPLPLGMGYLLTGLQCLLCYWVFFCASAWCWSSKRPRGDNPRPRSGAAPAFRCSSREEIPHVQGQERWLYFAGPDCGSQQTVENSSRDGNTRPPDLPPEKQYAGQEATVRTRHGTTDWFQIRKGVCEGCILSPCLFNVHAEYII